MDDSATWLPHDPFALDVHDPSPDATLALRVFAAQVFREYWGPHIHALVLGGGAMYGMMYIGVLMALSRYSRSAYRHWVDTSLKIVSGTSAGALVGFLIVAGVCLWDMPDIICKAHLERLLGGLLDAPPGELLRRAALTNGKGFDKVLQEIVKAVTGESDCTFGQLHVRTGRKFVVCVTNLTANRPEFWSHETHDSTPIWLALRCTASVPGVFPAVAGLPAQYYDGGIVCNVPCHLTAAQHTLTLLVHNTPVPWSDTSAAPEQRGQLLQLLLHLVTTYGCSAQLGPMRTAPAYTLHTIPCIPQTRMGVLGPYAFDSDAATVKSLIADGARCVFRTVMCHVRIAVLLRLRGISAPLVM